MHKIENGSKRLVADRVYLWFAGLLFSCVAMMGAAAPALAQVDNATRAGSTRDDLTSPERLSSSFAEVSRRVEQAVVNIDTKGSVPDVKSKGDEREQDSNDIMDFFRRQLPPRPAYSVGSGFIVDRSGYILTNAHVIEDAARITVSLPTGEEYVARVVGMDEETDLAVLKIEANRELPFIRLGDSDGVQIGDWVLAIGSPFGLSRTVTAGIISQTHRETPSGSPFQEFLQTDAAINRGNSGGPLVNLRGEVIGINSQIATSTGDYNGIGFALPSNSAASVYRQIVENGKVRRGYLGVLLDSVKAEFARVYGLPEAKGAIITEVRDNNSAAATAGLRVNDVILEFNGQKIENAQDLIKRVSDTMPDQAVTITFLRENGQELERRTTAITLAERPSNNRVLDNDEPRKLPVTKVSRSNEPFGLTLAELTPDISKLYRLNDEKGLIVKSIDPASFIADLKSSSGGDALSEGDLIQRINRRPVSSLRDFIDFAGKLNKGDAVVLHILNFNRELRSMQVRVVQFTIR